MGHEQFGIEEGRKAQGARHKAESIGSEDRRQRSRCSASGFENVNSSSHPYIWWIKPQLDP
jgi:hypothetical protein